MDRLRWLVEAGVWVDRTGKAWRVEQLSDEHLANLGVFMLRQQAKYTEAVEVLLEESARRVLGSGQPIGYYGCPPDCRGECACE